MKRINWIGVFKMLFIFIIGGVAVFSFITIFRIAAKANLNWCLFLHFPLKAFSIFYIIAYDGLKSANYIWLYNFSKIYLITLIAVTFIDWVIMVPNNKDFQL